MSRFRVKSCCQWCLNSKSDIFQSNNKKAFSTSDASSVTLLYPQLVFTQVKFNASLPQLLICWFGHSLIDSVVKDRDLFYRLTVKLLKKLDCNWMYISILLPKMSSLHSTNHQLVLAKWNINKERVLAKTVKKISQLYDVFKRTG